MLSSKGFSTEDRLSAASGGNNTYTYSDASGDYKIHKFTATGDFTINLPMPLDILVIGGGGSGGGQGSRAAGGAGGLRWFTDQHLISGVYGCTIGAGGGDPPASDTEGFDGAHSSFVKSGTISIFATGGGSGGGSGSAPARNGNSGGSGGGGNFGGTAGPANAGSYTPVEGYAGGTGSTDGGSNSWYYGGGGGGGAGGAGGNGSGTAGGAGGVGEDNFLNQSSTAFGQSATTAFLNAASAGELVSGVRYIAGGGGGGLYLHGSATAGGHGGGGDGGYGASGSGTTAGTNGTANTGSGGGGGANSYKGGQGGSGIILIRYRLH